MIAGPPVTTTELPLKVFARGKVRDTYEIVDDMLHLVPTDRLCAFDDILPHDIEYRSMFQSQLALVCLS